MRCAQAFLARAASKGGSPFVSGPSRTGCERPFMADPGNRAASGDRRLHRCVQLPQPTHSGQTTFSKPVSRPNPDFANRSATKRPLATSPDRPTTDIRASSENWRQSREVWVPRSVRGAFILNDRSEAAVGGADIGRRWRYRTGRPHHELAGQYRSCVARADRTVYRRRVNRYLDRRMVETRLDTQPRVPDRASHRDRRRRDSRYS